MNDSSFKIYSLLSTPVGIDSSGNLYITMNSVFNLTLQIIVTSTCTSSCYSSSSNSVTSNWFEISQAINCGNLVISKSLNYKYF